MCSWRNITTIITTTIITISGGGIGITTTITITTITIATIDDRQDAEREQDPLGSCSLLIAVSTRHYCSRAFSFAAR